MLVKPRSFDKNLVPGVFNLLKNGTRALTSCSKSQAISARVVALGSKFIKAQSKNISRRTGLREKSSLLKLGRLSDRGAPRNSPDFSNVHA